jgi:hypothetical protein
LAERIAGQKSRRATEGEEAEGEEAEGECMARQKTRLTPVQCKACWAFGHVLKEAKIARFTSVVEAFVLVSACKYK